MNLRLSIDRQRPCCHALRRLAGFQRRCRNPPAVSNVFVNPMTMPAWLQAFTEANPVSHLVTAERELMNGDAALEQVGWALLAAALLTAVSAPWPCTRYRTAG